MKFLIDAIENGIFSLLNLILNKILLLKIWLQDRFQRTGRTDEPFTVLEMVFYVDDNCEGYILNADLFGVTNWRDILNLVDQQYNNLISDEVGNCPDARLDVRYSLLGQNYHVIYQYGNSPHIVYPPYSLDRVEAHLRETHALVPILHAVRGGADLTGVVAEYAGPLGNFYSDSAAVAVMKGRWICRGEGAAGGSSNDLVITDSDCNDHLFQNSTAIRLTHTPPRTNLMAALDRQVNSFSHHRSMILERYELNSEFTAVVAIGSTNNNVSLPELNTSSSSAAVSTPDTPRPKKDYDSEKSFEPSDEVFHDHLEHLSRSGAIEVSDTSDIGAASATSDTASAAASEQDEFVVVEEVHKDGFVFYRI